MNNKQRVVIAARKRGFTVEQTRNLLRAASAPPTRSEKPADRIHRRIPTMEEDVFISSKDRRDISADLADSIINQLNIKENRNE